MKPADFSFKLLYLMSIIFFRLGVILLTSKWGQFLLSYSFQRFLLLFEVFEFIVLDRMQIWVSLHNDHRSGNLAVPIKRLQVRVLVDGSACCAQITD